ncbi:MAG: aldo/keto reductase [Asgard group archaeon]|nr:aldo/keto reductase [Asgard group archaeon]
MWGINLEKIRFGKTDLKVSRIGLGTLAFGHKFKGIQDKDQIHNCINFALDNGINLIDTAEEYAGGIAEQHIGDVIKERGDREDIVLVTKVSKLNLSYKNVLKSAKRSLKHLQFDHIDVYLIHWPDTYSPLSETMKAMDELLEEGLVRYIGVSNFPNTLLQEANNYLQNGSIVVNELEYNLINRSIEKEILPFLRQQNIPALTYKPLYSGYLTTNFDENYVFPDNDYRKQWELYRHKENFEITRELFKTLREIAKNHEVTPAEVATNWLLKDTDIIPIIGSAKISHIESSIHATQWRLSNDEISQLNAVSDNLELNFDWLDRVR